MDEKQVKSKVCGINIDKEIKEETVIFLYKTFGMGAVQELPNSYWVENGLIKSKYIVKYLIEKILKYKSRKKLATEGGAEDAVLSEAEAVDTVPVLETTEEVQEKKDNTNITQGDIKDGGKDH